MALKIAKAVLDGLDVWRKFANKTKPYRKSRYGITDEQYDHMLKAQSFGCKICGTHHFPYKGPCVDHDHTTGKVRGLLCFNCNRGIGAFKEDVAIVEKALKYLQSQD
jgi:hypothetical protein